MQAEKEDSLVSVSSEIKSLI